MEYDVQAKGRNLATFAKWAPNRCQKGAVVGSQRAGCIRPGCDFPAQRPDGSPVEKGGEAKEQSQVKAMRLKESAGINRLGVADERAAQERASDPP